MASAELVILSSSPFRPTSSHTRSTPPPAQRIVLNSSSPLSDELSPLTSLWQSAPLHSLRSGSRIEAVPHGALAGFASTAALVNNGVLGVDGTDGRDFSRPEERRQTGHVSAIPECSKKRKRAPTKQRDKDGKCASREVTRQRQTEKLEGSVGTGSAHANFATAECSPNPTKTAQGGCAEKVVTERQSVESKKTSIARGAAVKKKAPSMETKKGKGEKTRAGGNKNVPRATKSRRSTGTTSEHFNTSIETEREKQRAIDLEEGSATGQISEQKFEYVGPQTVSCAVTDSTSTSGEPYQAKNSGATSHGLPNAADIEPDVSIEINEINRQSNEIAVPKKKRKTNESAKDHATKSKVVERIKKPKAPKKKALTITGLATSPFKKTESVDLVTTDAAPCLQLIEDQIRIAPPTDTGETPQPTEEAGKLEKGRLSRSKSPTKREPKTRKSRKKDKKPEVVLPTLLSPQSALGQLAHQDIVFGTSSQLAQGDSPSFVRNLRFAIQESESMATAATREMTDGRVASTKRLGAKLSKGKLGIWGAASRDSQNELFHVGQNDTSTKVTSMAVQERQSSPVKSPTINLSNRVDGTRDTDLQDQATSTPDLSTKQSIQYTSIDEFDGADAHTAEETQTFAHIDEFETRLEVNIGGENKMPSPTPISRNSPLPSADHSFGVHCPRRRNVLGMLPTNTEIPTANAFGARTQTARLHGFPTKSAAAPTLEDALSAKPSPKRHRGRPRKDAAPVQTVVGALPATKRSAVRTVAEPSTSTKKGKKSKWVHIDDIEDSEVDTAVPLTPRRRKGKRQTTDPTRELELSPSQSSTETAEAPDPLPEKVCVSDWDSVKIGLYPQITRVLKSAPRTRDQRRPNWFEKMLLYDPIVIEDLTAWVNEQSVTVAWKNGEQELEPWMVQKWCEDNSVCCLWKSGLRGGVRASY